MFNIRKRRIAAAAAALTVSAALVLTGCSGGGGEAAATYDPDEEVTLNFAFWGNDVRAAMYEEAIAAFNEEYPNITVNTSFLGFPEFWEKRQTEAAGGGLPDVMQFDYSYLRQYSENGLLLATVLLNVQGRDVGGFVEEARATVAQNVSLPPGYYVGWSGRWENQERARARLHIVLPIVLLGNRDGTRIDEPVQAVVPRPFRLEDVLWSIAECRHAAV